ncbi:MAG TPA: hypothetical protein VKY26_04730 [Actinomycetota bacterium]|nr:hypothetical protein [Actinomycetota bacterium]
MQTLYLLIWAVSARVRAVATASDGFTTAELLGNAALAIVALIAIWGALRLLGINVINDISTKLSQF